jgi:tetratricopeptide (TPR) repeat protein
MASLVMVILSAGCQEQADPSNASKSSHEQTAAASGAATSSELSARGDDASAGAKSLIADLDQTIAFSRSRVAKADEPSWIDLQRVGEAYLTRARLTGSYDDYAEAASALERGDELAPPKSGPKHALARLNFALHRFDQVEPNLEVIEKRPLVDADSNAGLLGIRGDLALQQGQLDRALELYQRSHELSASAASAARLGNFHLKTANFSAAQSAYDEASRLARPSSRLTRAWVHLQQGIFELERGRLDPAYASFSKADDVLPGWYLVEEHIAEVHARRGDYDKARAMYEEIVATVPSGEFMDALAEVYEASDEPVKAREMRAQARKAYERDLARFAEAAYGHALDHFLAGPDSARALELARSNYDTRPNPSSAVKLAQAHVRHGELEEARSHIEQAIESRWDTAELHATAARIYQLSGQHAKAKRHNKRAEQLNPLAVGDLAELEPATGTTVVER